MSWDDAAGQAPVPNEPVAQMAECPPGLHTEAECGTVFPDGAKPKPEPEPKPPVKPRRPHWLPEEVWLGKVDGQWPLQAFTSQTQAEAWAMVQSTHRRIWPVKIPADTPAYTVREIPSRVELVQVKP